MRHGHSLYEVKKLLGHANITATQRYTHLGPGQLCNTSATVAEVFDIPLSEPVVCHAPARG